MPRICGLPERHRRTGTGRLPRIDAGAHGRDIQFHGTSFRWIVGYSVWNWTFVYLNYPELAGHHAAVLLSCAIVGAMDPRLWLQARPCTLGAHLVAMVTFPELIRSGLDTSHWSDPVVGLCAALAALVVAGCELCHRLAPPALADRAGVTGTPVPYAVRNLAPQHMTVRSANFVARSIGTARQITLRISWVCNEVTRCSADTEERVQ